MRNKWLFVCLLVVVTPLFASALTVDERRAQLEQELNKVEQEIKVQSVLLQSQRQQSASIQRDVSVLGTEINKAQLEIKSKNISITNIAKDINGKINTITSLEDDLTARRDYLRKLLQSSSELDGLSLPEVVLGYNKLSDFFSAEDTLVTVQGEVRDSMDLIRGVKKETEQVKQSLEEKKVAEASAKLEIELKKKKVEQKESEKKKILSVSKTQEKGYEAVLIDRQKRATSIRTALFSLRDTSAIPFGKALQYAQEAEKKTGVRPAFLLAILTQETNLGQNIGTCNRPTDPPEKRWDQIMKPSRDIEPYKRITAGLGLSPESNPLSCPYRGGWGGAMGPSQFIPSTWEIYQSKIAAFTGHTPPNPWDPEDAFMASAIYLSELGAGQRTFAAEREAALRYYAGGNWSKPSNAFYGDSVMGIAGNIQNNMIDPLQGL